MDEIEKKLELGPDDILIIGIDDVPKRYKEWQRIDPWGHALKSGIYIERHKCVPEDLQQVLEEAEFTCQGLFGTMPEGVYREITNTDKITLFKRENKADIQ